MTRGAAVFALLFGLAAAGAARADPGTLWRIVHEQCVPDEVQRHDPAPCALVDLRRGYVVLKDLAGATQFLVLPTARMGGIESAAILAPGAPNYMAEAWEARRFVAARAHRALPREDVALAINSVAGRTQDQFHIHVDCASPALRAALARHGAALGERWAPFPEPLAGHRYLARRLLGGLARINPFRLLADGVPGARGHMGDYTLVLVGARFAGLPGFVLLADRASANDRASGEELEDHACAVAG
jgi:CDP-diacylglycerol pyrophosphatase